MVTKLSRESKVGHDSIMYIIGGFLSSSISAFLLIPILVANLSTEEYGVISLVAVSASGLSIISTMGAHGSITQNYHSLDSHFGENRDVIGTIFSLTFLIGGFLFLMLAVSLFFTNNDQLLGGNFYFFSAIVIGLGTFDAVILISSTIFKIQAKPFHFLGLNLSRIVLILILVIYLVRINNISDSSKVSADLIALLVVSLVSLWILRSEFNLGINVNVLRKTLEFGIPLLPHMLAVFLLNAGDRYIIEILLGTEEVGIYSIGYQISLSIAIVSMGIDQAWTSYFYERVNKTSNSENVPSSIFHAYSAGVSLFAILFISASPLIYDILGIEGSYRDSLDFIPIIVVGLILQGIYFLSSKPILQKRKTLLLSSISVFCAFSNVIFNLILIPIMGLQGAAYATLLSYLIQVILTLVFSQRLISIPISHYKTFSPIIIVSMTFVLMPFQSILPAQNFVFVLLVTTILIFCSMSYREIKVFFAS